MKVYFVRRKKYVVKLWFVVGSCPFCFTSKISDPSSGKRGLKSVFSDFLFFDGHNTLHQTKKMGCDLISFWLAAHYLSICSTLHIRGSPFSGPLFFSRSVPTTSGFRFYKAFCRIFISVRVNVPLTHYSVVSSRLPPLISLPILLFLTVPYNCALILIMLTGFLSRFLGCFLWSPLLCCRSHLPAAV